MMGEHRDSPEADSENFRAGLANTLRLLREDAGELERGRWEEAIRSRMRSHAQSLAGLSKSAGRKDLVRILETLGSLLGLSEGEALPMGAEVSRKIIELLGMLEELA